MLKDITIGQYYPGNSFVHRLDPRFKIIITLLYITMLFMGSHLYSMVFGIVFFFLTFFCSGIAAKVLLKSMKPILPILLITAILDLLFIRDGTVYWSLGFLQITQEGVKTGVQMIIRISFLIVGTSMLTYTTSPIALTDGIERLLSPLKKIKLPVHELAMMMTIALRFIPTLIEETDKIMSAQKARGADLESGGVMQRAKALLPILIPLFVSAFRRADELALAMECRCYHGGEGRTRMKQMKLHGRDLISGVATAAVFAGVILLNKYVNLLPTIW